MNSYQSQKTIEGNHGYIIFLDDIRVDQLVTSWSVSLSANSAMGSARIEMLYAPQLDKIYTQNDEGTDIILDGVPHMTCLRIYVKNMFNDKYNAVFEGNIKSKQHSITAASGQRISFTAVDYTDWLDRIIAPLSLPIDVNIYRTMTQFKWNSHGVDTSSTDNLTSQSDIDFSGKNIREYIYDVLLKKTKENNVFFQEEDSVLAFDAPTDRINILGDVSDNIKSKKIVDMVLSTNIENVNSWYKNLNSVLRPLSFEIFQDRDGQIKIKPPFYGQAVMRSHMIDPTLVISYSSSENYANRSTRVITTGGLTTLEELSDENYAEMIIPLGTFIGDSVNQDTDSVWNYFTSFASD